MHLKNIEVEKSDLYAYLRFCACEEKKNRKISTIKNVAPTKPVKVLYEQKLVFWDQLKNLIVLMTVVLLNL